MLCPTRGTFVTCFKKPLWPTAAMPPVQPVSSASTLDPERVTPDRMLRRAGAGESPRWCMAPVVGEPPPGDGMAPFLRSPFLLKRKKKEKEKIHVFSLTPGTGGFSWKSCKIRLFPALMKKHGILMKSGADRAKISQKITTS